MTMFGGPSADTFSVISIKFGSRQIGNRPICRDCVMPESEVLDRSSEDVYSIYVKMLEVWKHYIIGFEMPRLC